MSVRGKVSRSTLADANRVRDWRIKYYDAETNNLTLPPLSIPELYRCRWQVELFFKWIKQHLRINPFCSTSENAVRTQIWMAVSVYVLVAILKKKLVLEAYLYNILQILNVTVYDKICLYYLLTFSDYNMPNLDSSNQLNLFE